MKSTNQPIFTNTCGKIFPTKIILASANREKTIEMEDLKGISFKAGVAPSGLLFALIPAVFFIFIFTLKPDQFVLKILFAVLGTVGIFFSLLKAKRTYSLSVYTGDGEKLTVKVWEGNVREAKKFAEITNNVRKSYNRAVSTTDDEQLSATMPAASVK